MIKKTTAPMLKKLEHKVKQELIESLIFEVYCSIFLHRGLAKGRKMSIFSFLGVLSPMQISCYSLRNRIFNGGRLAGEDQFGNVYYTAKARKGYDRERRWVMYKGRPEASDVPAEWHGWLHHQTDVLPTEDTSYRRSWQKPSKPNQTGTDGAYRPPGHRLDKGQRDKTSGDYEAWTPPA